MKKFIKELIKLLITAGLFYLLFQRVPVSKVVSTIKSININYFFVSTGLFFFYYGLFALRWKFLLSAQNIKIRFPRAYVYILISFFFNNFLPSGVGMDVVRSGYAGGKKRFEKAFGASLIERMLGMIGMMIVGVLSFFSFGDEFVSLAILYFSLIVLIFLIYYLLISIKSDWMKKRILSINFLNLGESIRKFYRALKIYSDKKASILAGIGLSFLVQVVIILINYYLGKSLDVSISFIAFMGFIPLITIVSLVPVTINGLGMREGAYVLLFATYGISQNMALSLSLLFLASSIIASLTGGIAFLFVRKIDTEKWDYRTKNSGV